MPELRSRSVVLVDQAPEDVPAFDVGGASRNVRGVIGDRYRKADTAVRTLLVVMAHVGAQDTFSVATTDEQQLVEDIRDVAVRTQRSAYASARGALTGVRMVSLPSEAKTPSKGTL